uniref:Uncharacterized protein n=1 Tax=Arundo donax TaxID=35708 RepID=A0A0A9C7D0_ARUDO
MNTLVSYCGLIVCSCSWHDITFIWK